MAHINLLPWRQTEREERKQAFLVTLGAALIATAVTLGVVYLAYSHTLKVQRERNIFLQGKIRIADQKTREIENIKRERMRLVSQINIIQNLQSERPKVVKLLDAIPRIVTPGMYLTKLSRKSMSVEIHGFAESNPAVAKMMRNIDKTKVIHEPHDEFIRLVSQRQSSLDKEFNITARLK